MSTFVIVPGAWDTPSTMEPVIEPLGSSCHKVIVVDLPCGNPMPPRAPIKAAMRGQWRCGGAAIVNAHQWFAWEHQSS